MINKLVAIISLCTVSWCCEEFILGKVKKEKKVCLACISTSVVEEQAIPNAIDEECWNYDARSEYGQTLKIDEKTMECKGYCKLEVSRQILKQNVQNSVPNITIKIVRKCVLNAPDYAVFYTDRKAMMRNSFACMVIDGRSEVYCNNYCPAFSEYCNIVPINDMTFNKLTANLLHRHMLNMNRKNVEENELKKSTIEPTKEPLYESHKEPPANKTCMLCNDETVSDVQLPACYSRTDNYGDECDTCVWGFKLENLRHVGYQICHEAAQQPTIKNPTVEGGRLVCEENHCRILSESQMTSYCQYCDDETDQKCSKNEYTLSNMERLVLPCYYGKKCMIKKTRTPSGRVTYAAGCGDRMCYSKSFLDGTTFKCCDYEDKPCNTDIKSMLENRIIEPITVKYITDEIDNRIHKMNKNDLQFFVAMKSKATHRSNNRITNKWIQFSQSQLVIMVIVVCIIMIGVFVVCLQKYLSIKEKKIENDILERRTMKSIQSARVSQIFSSNQVPYSNQYLGGSPSEFNNNY